MKKKFYLLLRKQLPNYDEIDSMVVRAISSTQARQLANKQAADEGQIWTDASKVTCSVIHPNGVSKVIFNSFNAG